MLWDNDGTPGDVINAYTELFGDGAVMDSMRKLLTAEEQGREERERKEIARIAAKVKAWKERRHIMGDLDVVPEAKIPDFHYHRYAAAYRLRAQEEGITLPCQGYGCWQDSWHMAWYHRKYPELFYDEAPRNARILVNEFGKLPAATRLVASLPEAARIAA